MKDNPEGDQNMDIEEPVPVIPRKHFDEALGCARNSVTA